MQFLGTRGGAAESAPREPATAGAGAGAGGGKPQPKKSGGFDQMDDDIPF